MKWSRSRTLSTEQETVEFLRKALKEALPWEREELEESLRKSELALECARKGAA